MGGAADVAGGVAGAAGEVAGAAGAAAAGAAGTTQMQEESLMRARIREIVQQVKDKYSDKNFAGN
jgi:hypothetical protein